MIEKVSLEKAAESLVELFHKYRDNINNELQAKMIEDYVRILETKISESEEFREGFRELPKRTYLRLDHQNSHPWYVWNSETQSREYINQPLFCGSVRSLSLRVRTDNNANGTGGLSSGVYKNPQDLIEDKKLIINFDKHAIIVGHLTVFARQFVWGLVHWLKESGWEGGKFPIGIVARSISSNQSKGRRFVVCDLYTEDNSPIIVKAKPPLEWTDKDWDNYIQQAVEELNNLLGVMTLKPLESLEPTDLSTEIGGELEKSSFGNLDATFIKEAQEAENDLLYDGVNEDEELPF